MKDRAEEREEEEDGSMYVGREEISIDSLPTNARTPAF